MNKIHITSGDYYYIVEDLVRALEEVFKDLGYTVSFDFNKLHDTAININLGATAISLNDFYKVKDKLIHYNLEQINLNNPVAINKDHLDRLKIGYVWDFCQQNTQYLNCYGITNTAYIPIGYTESMTYIKSNNIQDIDVLFYGLETDRRIKVLNAIRDLGLNVVSSKGTKHTDLPLLNTYRNELISRSKVVLNVHAYEYNNIFEIVRVSHLLANKKAVVSEINNTTIIDQDIKSATTYGEVDLLPALCKYLVEHSEYRKYKERLGFTTFSKNKFKDYINFGLFSYCANKRMNHG